VRNFDIPTITAACSMGTVTAQADGFFGHIPIDSPGVRLRAMSVVVSTEVQKDPSNFWKLQVGLWSVGNFQVLEELYLQDGVKPSGLRREFQSDPRGPRGATIALRAFPVGTPAPLEGLSATLEYGIHGQR
jgi:hypothetical protein